MNTVSEDRRDLFFKLSLAEALEEVATRVAEKARLYNENAFNICFNYIHDSNLNSYIRFFESLRLPLAKRSFFRKPTRPSLPLRKAPPLISVFSPQARRRKPPSGAQNRYALRLADHQRSSPGCAGWDRLGTACFLSTLDCAGWEQLDSSSLQYRSALVVVRMRNIVLFYF